MTGNCLCHRLMTALPAHITWISASFSFVQLSTLSLQYSRVLNPRFSRTFLYPLHLPDAVMAKKSKALRNQRRNDQDKTRPQFQATGANSQPIISRLDRLSPAIEAHYRKEGVPDSGSLGLNHDRNFLADFSSRDSWLQDCPSLPHLPSPPRQISRLSSTTSGISTQISTVTHHVPTVTNESEANESSVQIMMNVNGTHPPHRHQQPHSQPNSQVQRDRRPHVNDNTGANTPNGPMPSHIQVAKPYIFHQAIEACISDLGVLQAGEDRIRLAGVQWIDNVRKALKLYVQVFFRCPTDSQLRICLL